MPESPSDDEIEILAAPERRPFPSSAAGASAAADSDCLSSSSGAARNLLPKGSHPLLLLTDDSDDELDYVQPLFRAGSTRPRDVRSADAGISNK